MPWLETDPMEQCERFLADHRRALYTMTELCDRDGITRKTGYKWLERYETEGRAGRKDRSHAPHHCPHKIEPKWPCSALHGGRTRTRGRLHCWTCYAHDTRGSATGRLPAPWATCLAV
jgi:hypothetical protein